MAMATQTTKQKTAAPAPEAERQVMPMPEGGWPPDEFTGLGGNYVRDPYTGIRRPAEEPAEDPATDPAAPTNLTE
jgi:hypothetical protein